jgi:hypothetical protein
MIRRFGEGAMSTTIVFVLAVWLALNAAFVALRLYVSSSPISRSDSLPPSLSNAREDDQSRGWLIGSHLADASSVVTKLGDIRPLQP